LSSSAGSADSAAFEASGSAEVVLLPAGSVARAQADAVLVRNERPAEIEQQLSWRSGVLTFRDTPLAEAIAEFNRYNERKIVIEDPSVATLQLGGSSAPPMSSPSSSSLSRASRFAQRKRAIASS